jgi:hypothetical protein
MRYTEETRYPFIFFNSVLYLVPLLLQYFSLLFIPPYDHPTVSKDHDWKIGPSSEQRSSGVAPEYNLTIITANKSATR